MISYNFRLLYKSRLIRTNCQYSARQVAKYSLCTIAMKLVFKVLAFVWACAVLVCFGGKQLKGLASDRLCQCYGNCVLAAYSIGNL